MMRLQGKTALITGSLTGIGRGIASAMAQEGANIILNGIDTPQEAENTRQELEKMGQRILYYKADVGNVQEVTTMITDAQKKLGSIDILVNNAGIQYVEPIDTFPIEKWDAMIATNLSSAFYTIRAVLPLMKEKKWGRIVNIASVHGLVASAYKSAYVAAKHGLVGLTKAAALDLAEFGITVNAICPGYVDTPLVRQQISEQAKAHHLSEDEVIPKVLLAHHAIKEFVTVEQIAAMTIYLCSDACKTVTGTALPIDAGWLAQ
ncbi:3-hydroxybutyrate dehydrogenase [Chlorogloeopsis sp. ULAP01]|uniref:3-hydroxybutyrate dehydrogenase n=1 Tax=Chlorogloeopsis sp. ULAP01 TaxID=3056483 RepID=UPI0025AB0C14|nr:3-hydroxybutyrate dehydrogenase [Chlorogloeopsis sp. ULAP01]MDM9379229.1 3-hydroxybutyrate dehydrogenase [Chlorogloeopsis sp. ULAP01]